MLNREKPVRVIRFHANQRMADALKHGADEVDEPEIWLDFAGVEAVTSAELSALIRFTLDVRQLGKSVFACNVGAGLQDLFGITRFHLDQIA